MNAHIHQGWHAWELRESDFSICGQFTKRGAAERAMADVIARYPGRQFSIVSVCQSAPGSPELWRCQPA